MDFFDQRASRTAAEARCRLEPQVRHPDRGRDPLGARFELLSRVLVDRRRAGARRRQTDARRRQVSHGRPRSGAPRNGPRRGRSRRCVAGHLLLGME